MKTQRSAILGIALAILGLAACEDKTEVNVPPPEPPPLEISVTPPSANVEVGKTTQFVASVTGGSATTAKTVTWTSSNTAVASIAANGNVVTVTGVTPGTSTIRAVATADANVIGAANVTVTASGGLPPNISIKSITTGATNVPVNVNNVFGQIEITLNLDVPTGTKVNQVKLLAGTIEIYSQTFTSPELGLATDEAQSAVDLVASWNTADFDRTLPATVGTRQGKYKNGSTTITAQVIGPQGTITASTSQTIILNNTPFVFVRRTAPTGTSCTLSAAGVQWCTGDIVFDAVGVSFSGNANDDVANLTLVGTGTGIGAHPGYAPFIVNATFTDATAPFQLTLQKATTPAASSIAAMEFAGVGFTVNGLTTGGQPLSGCVVTDATPAPLNLGCGVLGGLVLQAAPLNEDNVAPRVTLLDLTPATLGCAPATACYVNGVFSFALTNTGLIASNDPGVGSVTATFSAGPNTSSLLPVVTGNDLPETVTPTNILQVIACDKLVNCRTLFAGPVAATPLTSSTGAQLFGIDKTNPTASIAGLAANSINPADAVPDWTVSFSDGGVGPSGFSANPVRVQLLKARPAGNTCYTPNNPFTLTVVACLTSSGAINFQSDDGLIDIDFANVPGTSEAYWQVTAFVVDQAKNSSTPNISRVTLLDVTPPVSGGISGPSSLPGGANVTFSAGLSDNVDLKQISPSMDYGATTFQFAPTVLGAYGIADGLASSVTGNFTVAAFMRAIEATLGTGRAGGVVDEANLVRFDVTDQANNLATATLGINAAVQFPIPGPVPSLNVVSATIFAPANPLHGNFLHLAPTNATVCRGTTAQCTVNPQSTNLSATMTGPNATFANPFVRVEFYWQDPSNGRWVLIGTGVPSASDNTVTSTRTWTYTVTWTVTGIVDATGAPVLGAVPIVAVGVHSSGSALISAGTAQNVTIAAT
jgi:hypothetical protein